MPRGFSFPPAEESAVLTFPPRIKLGSARDSRCSTRTGGSRRIAPPESGFTREQAAPPTNAIVRRSHADGCSRILSQALGHPACCSARANKCGRHSGSPVLILGGRRVLLLASSHVRDCFYRFARPHGEFTARSALEQDASAEPPLVFCCTASLLSRFILINFFSARVGGFSVFLFEAALDLVKRSGPTNIPRSARRRLEPRVFFSQSRSRVVAGILLDLRRRRSSRQNRVESLKESGQVPGSGGGAWKLRNAAVSAVALARCS